MAGIGDRRHPSAKSQRLVPV